MMSHLLPRLMTSSCHRPLKISKFNITYGRRLYHHRLEIPSKPPTQTNWREVPLHVRSESHNSPSLRALKTKTHETCCMTRTMGGSRYLKTCGNAESSWTLNVALLGRQPKVSTLHMCIIVDSEDTVHFKFGNMILSFTYFSFSYFSFMFIAF